MLAHLRLDRRPSRAGRGDAITLLSHPLVVTSLLVLVANDHLGKPRYPGAITGIASDVAGLVLLPAVALAAMAAGSRRPVCLRGAAAIATIVAVGFASVELLAVADQAYEQALGTLGAPVRHALGQPGGGRVVATADRADLLALPASVVVPVLWHRAASSRAPAARRVLGDRPDQVRPTTP